MMKKKMITVLAAALFTLGASANAMAYWSAGDLIQVVYNQGGSVEVATDLGSVSSFVSGSATTSASPSFSLSQVSGATDYSQLYVTYFAVQTATSGNNNGTGYVNGVNGTASVTAYHQFNTFVANNNSLMAYYKSLDTGNSGQVIGQQSFANSYYTLMTKAGTAYGKLGTYIPAGTAETNLAALASGGSVTSTIYQLNNQGGTSGVTTGVVALDITTNSNGTVTVSNGQATPTPIPPSFLLMGSGLLGMVGIRRKFNA